MPLGVGALVALEDVKREIPVSGTGDDAILEEIINRASAVVESYLDRQVVSRGEITEYHPGAGERLGDAVISTNEFPILTVTSVHEDSSRAYGAGSLLAAGTDYIVSKPTGRLIRVGGAAGGLDYWDSSFRAVKVVYTAGYALADVPADIKDVVLRLAAMAYAETSRKQHGVSSMSDPLGNVTRFAAAQLTPALKAQLSTHRRRGRCTGERDA